MKSTDKTNKRPNKIRQWVKNILNPVSAKADVKRSHIIQLLVGLVVLVLVNVAGSYFFAKLDLTQEKRYSLSESSLSILKNTKDNTLRIKDVIMIRCYLDGDIPAGYKELRNALKDLLNEYRSYNSNIEYEFFDPNNFKTELEKGSFYESLFKKGFSPLLIKTENKGKQQQQYIFPYIEITFANRSVIKSLISTKTGFTENEVIEASIQNLEYTLYSSIRSLLQGRKDNIAFLYGQGEPDASYMLDMIQTLSDEYAVDSVTINEQLNALVERKYDSINPADIRFFKKYDCLIIAKPTKPFAPKDLYILDQYVMHGGKILWLIDPLTASMDSLQDKARTMAISNFTGAEELLFAYGMRLNNDLVMDLQCVKVPIVTGQYGNGQPQMTFYPWNFFPSVSPNADHVITDKLNPMKFDFVSTIDTVEGNNQTTVTPLLFTSANTRLLNAPVEVSLQMLKQKQDPKLFNQGSKVIAVLAEGKFASAFKNRLPAEMTENPMIANKDMSDSTAMIAVADGDIIINSFKNGQIVPLGYDLYNNQMFGNKEFLINCINYLCGHKDLIPLRSREVIVRNLDMAKVDRVRTSWQLFNILVPLGIVALIGSVIVIIRRKSYISK